MKTVVRCKKRNDVVVATERARFIQNRFKTPFLWLRVFFSALFLDRCFFDLQFLSCEFDMNGELHFV